MKRPDPAKPWDRKLWGVIADICGHRILLGATWCHERSALTYHEAEPSRTLLFKTRSQARAWAKQKMDEWQGTGAAHWKLRVVRVRETVMVEREMSSHDHPCHPQPRAAG